MKIPIQAIASDRVLGTFEEERNCRSDCPDIAEHSEDDNADVCAESIISCTSILNMLTEIQAVAFDCNVPEASLRLWKAKRAVVYTERKSSTVVPMLDSISSLNCCRRA